MLPVGRDGCRLVAIFVYVWQGRTIVLLRYNWCLCFFSSLFCEPKEHRLVLQPFLSIFPIFNKSRIPNNIIALWGTALRDILTTKRHPGHQSFPGFGQVLNPISSFSFFLICFLNNSIRHYRVTFHKGTMIPQSRRWLRMRPQAARQRQRCLALLPHTAWNFTSQVVIKAPQQKCRLRFPSLLSFSPPSFFSIFPSFM